MHDRIQLQEVINAAVTKPKAYQILTTDSKKTATTTARRVDSTKPTRVTVVTVKREALFSRGQISLPNVEAARNE